MADKAPRLWWMLCLAVSAGPVLAQDVQNEERSATSASAAEKPASATEAAADPATTEAAEAPDERPRLDVTLEAPEDVEPLLREHLRLLTRADTKVPESRGERAALERRTLREVEGLLATEGYFSPTVELKQTDDDSWTVSVEPGTRATIGAVDITLNGDIASDPAQRGRREALVEAWSLAEGQPFRQADWDGAKQRLLDGVAFKDYAAARIVNSRAEVDREAARVRLSITVDSGPPFFLGPIEVSGIERLPRTLVHAHSTIREGQPYDLEKLLAFQSALQNQPQFASVVVEVERDPAQAHAAPVRVRVAEANSRHLSFSAGYSTNTGARAEMNWRNVNLFRRGWELSTGLRLEEKRQSLYADLFLPPYDSGYRDSFGALYDLSDISGLKTTNTAIGMTRSKYRGNIETGLTLRFQHEKLEPSGLPETSLTALTLNWMWTRRAVDDVMDPRRGYVLRTELGGGTKTLLSDQNFLRSYTRASWYRPMRDTDTLILRGEFGATLAPSREGIPQDFLFRTGGSQSVRGYRFNSLGVKEGGATLGGRYLVTASAEYVHWFQPKWGVAGFVDVGDAADSFSDLNLRTGIGLGARWRSPAGPIALDLAYGMRDQQPRLHFSIGIAF